MFCSKSRGSNPKRWDCSGLVVEVLPHNQYTLKIDGSGRLTKRNRRFLRLYKPASSVVTDSPRSNFLTDLPITSPVTSAANRSNDSINVTGGHGTMFRADVDDGVVYPPVIGTTPTQSPTQILPCANEEADAMPEPAIEITPAPGGNEGQAGCPETCGA